MDFSLGNLMCYPTASVVGQLEHWSTMCVDVLMSEATGVVHGSLCEKILTFSPEKLEPCAMNPTLCVTVFLTYFRIHFEATCLKKFAWWPFDWMSIEWLFFGSVVFMFAKHFITFHFTS